MIRRSPLLSLALVALLGLAACERAGTYQQSIYVFGTLVDITIWGLPADEAREHVAFVARRFREMHRQWHAWQPGALSELNEAIGKGETYAASRELVGLLKLGTTLYQRSGGLFNPAIGRLIELWGFHQDDPTQGQPPPDRAVVAALVRSNPNMNDLRIDQERVSSTNPDVQLDLGGFAKGYAVDWAIEALRKRGVENAIVNAGGDLRAIGSKGGKPWRIGVRHPQGKGVLAALQVQGDESVFTSGNYERYNEHEGVRYAHIIDPRTGQPVVGITSVTVIHNPGVEADAAATALVVAGAEAWPRIARSMGVRHAVVVEENGTVHMTPEMARRVTFQGAPPPVKITPLD
ncbi:MAG: FAD:protein FMN transferase [Gammaproteobacteria bacterium]